MAEDLLLVAILTAVWAWLGAHSEPPHRREAVGAPAAGLSDQRPEAGDRPSDEDRPRPTV